MIYFQHRLLGSVVAYRDRMHHRCAIGIIATVLALSVFSGCGDQGPMTYRTWSDTRAVRVIQFDKATTPESTLNEWDAKGVRWRQDKDHYYVEETDIGKTSENIAFNTVATPFTVAMDGAVLAVYVVASANVSTVASPAGMAAGAAVQTAAATTIAIADNTTNNPLPRSMGQSTMKPPIRVVVFPKATTPESETKRWTDADMRWFQDDTHYFVPVTDIGKVVQDVRFRALPEPLVVTVDGKRLEAVTEATPMGER